jgi:TrmH family RNA methyltransferase
LAEERVRKISLSQINAFSSHKNSQGIIAVVKIPQDSFSESVPSETGDKILLLEHIQDPGNVGTLLRTAAAFDFSGVVLSSMSADPFSSKTVQASAGSLLSLWIRRTPNYIKTVEHLQKMGFKLAAMSINGSENPLDTKGKIIVALGNEGNGLSQDILSMADTHCRISINDKKVESLNVAITGALVMYGVRSGK